MPANWTILPCNPRQLLRLSQSGGRYTHAARDCVVALFRHKLRELAIRTCRRYYLHAQESDDVLAETFLQIFNPEIVRFAASRGEPQNYFRGLVQNAARKIMAQLGARRRKRSPSEATAADSQQGGSAQGPGSVMYGRRAHPALPSPVRSAEVRDTVKFVLDQASPRVRRALELCYWEDWSVQRIAEELGMSRFALAREIRRFFKKIKTDLQ